MNTVDSGNGMLTEHDVLGASKCFSILNYIYIVIDDNSDIFVFDVRSGEWGKRSDESFWDSWNFDPNVYAPISNQKAAQMIFSTATHMV